MKQYDTILLRGQEWLALAVEQEEVEEASRYRVVDRCLVDEDGCRLQYTGGLVLGAELAAIPLTEVRPACYHYNMVYEVLFENGRAVALIDHSQAVRRVAKNLEYGLRTLTKRRDVFAIRRFLKKEFIRKYPVKWVRRAE